MVSEAFLSINIENASYTFRVEYMVSGKTNLFRDQFDMSNQVVSIPIDNGTVREITIIEAGVTYTAGGAQILYQPAENAALFIAPVYKSYDLVAGNPTPSNDTGIRVAMGQPFNPSAIGLPLTFDFASASMIVNTPSDSPITWLTMSFTMKIVFK